MINKINTIKNFGVFLKILMAVPCLDLKSLILYMVGTIQVRHYYQEFSDG